MAKKPQRGRGLGRPNRPLVPPNKAKRPVRRVSPPATPDRQSVSPEDREKIALMQVSGYLTPDQKAWVEQMVANGHPVEDAIQQCNPGNTTFINDVLGGSIDATVEMAQPSHTHVVKPSVKPSASDMRGELNDYFNNNQLSAMDIQDIVMQVKEGADYHTILSQKLRKPSLPTVELNSGNGNGRRVSKKPIPAPADPTVELAPRTGGNVSKKAGIEIPKKSRVPSPKPIAPPGGISIIDEADLKGELDNQGPTVSLDGLLDQQIAELKDLESGEVEPSGRATVTIDDNRVIPNTIAESPRSAPSGALSLHAYFDPQKLLGRGGMGEVLLAGQSGLERPVALKKPLFDKARNDQAREAMYRNFMREAQVMGLLSHPNIPEVYAIHDGPDAYMIMQVVNGLELTDSIEGDVRALLKMRDESSNSPEKKEVLDRVIKHLSGSPEDRMKRNIEHLIAVCEGMDYAHSKGVVHRDLKPENIMVGAYGEVLIMDWGLAKARGVNGDNTHVDLNTEPLPSRVTENLTMDGAIKGTPIYMSPEQAKDTKSVDHRSDIYTLGSILYNICTRRPPFVKGKENMYVFLDKKVMQNRFTRPRKLNKDIPADLESIILKARATKPEDRYQSAGELAEDLRRYNRGDLVEAHNYGPIEKTRHYLSKHPKMALGVGMGVFSLTVMSILGSVFYSQTQAAELQAEQARTALVSEQLESEQASADAAQARALAAISAQEAAEAEQAAAEAEARDLQRRLASAEINTQIMLLHNDVERGIDLESAVRGYNKIIDDHPGHVNALYHRGLAHYALLNAEAAIKDFHDANENSVAETGKKDLRALIKEAIVGLDLNPGAGTYVDPARDVLRTDLPSDNAFRLIAQSIIDASESNFDDAIDNAEEVSDQYWEANLLLAFYHAKGLSAGGFFSNSVLADYQDYEAAQEYIQDGLRLKPNQPRLLWFSQLFHAANGDNQARIPILEQLAERYPDEGLYHSEIAGVYATLGQLTEARRSLSEARRLDDNSPSFYMSSAAIDNTSGNWSAAESTLTEAIQRFGEWYGFYTERAYARGQQAEWTDAFSDINTAIQLNPEDGRSYAVRALIRKSQPGRNTNDLETAEYDYECAVRLGYLAANYGLGNVRLLLNKNGEAIEAYNAYLASGLTSYAEQARQRLAELQR